ncbi:conjugal transfer protein [Shimazuella kribbensis]|uniref:conjugal transfer protein n=1 Tax=Shimazuella kribbensis TaxID=139808 RepID=UPI00040580EF|nr:conjugal transfer protein [Shimazuella kribbensis]
MDRYVITAKARRIVIVILCFAALAWGVRQVALTVKVWTTAPETKKEVVNLAPVVPDGAKTVGNKFLLYWFAGKSDNMDDKITVLKGYSTQRVQTDLDENSTIIPMGDSKFLSIDRWDEKWLEAGKKAYVGYQVQFKDGRTFIIQLPIVKSGATWLVDGLPSLLPDPEVETQSILESPSVPDSEMQLVQQAVDGFFDSWLVGRKDQNTKYQNVTPTDVLGLIGGTYKDVSVKPLKNYPLIVSAIITIDAKGQILPFEYQLELEKKDGQYVVKKVLGGK